MSEGTPGRGPDADPRTGTGDGQASTNGRPAVPPVRYGPRNGGPANGTNGRGTTGRTVPGTSSPQQYRAPQPPRTPTKDGSGTGGAGKNGTGGASKNGNGGAGKNGVGSNGSGSNGSHPATPVSYTRPRPAGAAPRPEPSEQDRLVAEARIAAAARNASAARGRGGSAPSGRAQPGAGPRSSTTTSDPSVSVAPVDETAVISAVKPQDESAETATPVATPDEQTPSPDKGRTRFGRLRGGRGGRSPQAAETPAALASPVVAAAPAETSTTESPKVEAPPVETPKAKTTDTSEQAAEQRSGSEAVATTEQDAATEQGPLTWRDRLGLPPKEQKPESVDASSTSAATAAAPSSTDSVVPAAATVVTGSTPTALVPVQGRITPTAPVTTSDTVVIPAVDAATGAPTPVAGSTALPVVAPKAKVGAARRTRKARLRLSRVDPWSVMKTALLFSIAGGIILVVATYGVWSVLNASGLFASVNDMVKSVVSTPGDTTPFRIEEYVNTQKIIGVAALIAVVDVLIFTALATLGSFLYNLAATVLGGLEVTLAED